MRNLTLLLFVVSTAGSTCDLILLGHFEDARQWLPLLVLPTGLLVLAWHRIRQGYVDTRTFQGAMVLFVVVGVAGTWFHFRSNAEFELMLHPSVDGWELVRAALSGRTPALAPAILVQLGLLGLTYTYRHPLLRRRPDRPRSVLALGSVR